MIRSIIAVCITSNLSGSPPTDNWILNTGFWVDSGSWIDADVWID